MKPTIKKKKLEEIFQQLTQIENFKFELDQYQTSPQVASLFIHNINQNYGFEDKIVVELGSGSGILGIGALLCDAKFVIFIDIDDDCINILKENLNYLGIDKTMYRIMKEDVFEMDTSILLKQIEDIFGIDTKCDFVISNPPFGIQSIKNADTFFLKKALEIAEDGIFTMHKSSTIEYLRKLINEDKNGKFTIYNETFTEFDIPKTYKFHKEDSKNIEVVFLDIINKECI